SFAVAEVEREWKAARSRYKLGARSPITEANLSTTMFGWIYLLLLLCIASSIHCDLTPTRFDRQDRDYRPLQFGKRDGYRPLQFGKKSYRPLQFGKRRAYDFSEYTPY
uniref:Neuropeptide-Like Protein n=2 Tax=Ascaris TaxID=6251 RepID=A0A0M3HT12_ASCLU